MGKQSLCTQTVYALGDGENFLVHVLMHAHSVMSESLQPQGRATWVGPQAERPRFPGPLLRRTRHGNFLGDRSPVWGYYE